MDTIVQTLNQNLCISCGVCAANCPKNCITMKRSENMFFPNIDMEHCISCGMCLKVCPSHEMCSYDGKSSVSEFLLGDYHKILCAYAKSEEVLKHATSGGVVTQLVTELIKCEKYTSAFLVNGYQYDRLLETKRFENKDDFSQTPKSRYLTISHEQSVKYMVSHPDERIILVATGCAVQGILNTIRMRKLNRDNYFIIGLFCDKTMGYGVVDYFSAHPVNKGRKLRDFYFRTKDAGGWPGNVRLVYTDDSHEDLPNTERMKVKDYFMPERCLYCLDKLNRGCDIAVGDNYIAENKNEKGASSVIIRTQLGSDNWNLCKELFCFYEDSSEDLIKSQKLVLKKQNYSFWKMKQLNGFNKQDKAYKEALAKIEIGKQSSYEKINHDYKVKRLKRRIKGFIKRPITKLLGK